MIKFRRALSYFPQMHTDLYFSVWPFNHWQQSISARWLDALNMCWSTFGSCGFRQILKIYFSYKALLAFFKYLQHRNEGLPMLIWSWNWLYVQFFSVWLSFPTMLHEKVILGLNSFPCELSKIVLQPLDTSRIVLQSLEISRIFLYSLWLALWM